MANNFEQRYIAARRAVIEKDFMHLNPEQRRAVMTTQGPLLLLAGAGSGKTTVLINRITNLLRYGSGSDSTEIPEGASEQDIELMLSEDADSARRKAAYEPIEPWRIIAITFTNKAADELKNRLEQALGPEARDIWAQTFHSACVRILRRDADKIGFSSSFTIYDTQDSLSVIKQILKAKNIDDKNLTPRSILSQISKTKDEMLEAATYLENAKKSYDMRAIQIGEVYVEYEKRLKDADAMDFDDLILNAVRLLQESEETRTHYQKRFKHVLVDEYQDTNKLQYLLTSILSGGHENICVVGDDDQSIYKFRGATIENILSFENQHKNAKLIKLEQNYRSTGHILESANAVIRNNLGRKGKELWTAADSGEKPSLHAAYNHDAEAQYVAEKILEGYSQNGRWDDHAVLYRLNALSNQLEYAFKRRGIPYRVYGGTRFFDRAEIKDMLAYLNVILNPADDLRLIRIINTPTRGIGDTAVSKVSQIAQDRGESVFNILCHVEDYPELKAPAAKLRLFVDMIKKLREASENLAVDNLYDEIIEKTGYLRALAEKDTQENITRAENVQELKSNIYSYMQETGDATLFGFLDEISLYTDLDNLESNADCVTVMTIHSSKGLEFPIVFLVGAEEGIFPGTRTLGYPAELEEERRLCYVAITRAKKKLYISCALSRMLMGKTTNNRVSRFIEEIPPEHIQKTNVPKGRNFSDLPTDLDESARRQAAQRPIRPIITSKTAQSALPQFSIGDNISHKSFGAGVISSMTAMGGDFLVEINFEDVGTKRLMLKAASKLMQKN